MIDFGIFLNQYFWLKIVTLIGILFYIIFSAVLFNQVKTMNQIVSQPSSNIVELVAKINLIASLSLFIAAIGIL